VEDEWFKICVPAHTLYKLITPMPSDEFVIEVDGLTMIVTSDNGSFRVAGMDHENYPNSNLAKSKIGEISRSGLSELSEGVQFAGNDPLTVGSNANDPAFKCCHLVLTKNLATAYSTDRAKICRKSVEFNGESEVEFNVLADFFMSAVSIIDGDNPIEFFLDDKSFKMVSGGTQVFMSCSNIPYPKIPELIEGILRGHKKKATCVVVDSKTLVNALGTSSVLASESDGGYMLLKIGDDSLTLIVKAENGESNLTVPIIKKSGDAGVEQVGLNCKRLKECVAIAKGDKITLNFSSPKDPILMHRVDRTDWYSTISPMQIR
jgi:DNA polymerase III sliding clamp (beta) subunit (PCNA family)